MLDMELQLAEEETLLSKECMSLQDTSSILQTSSDMEMLSQSMLEIKKKCSTTTEDVVRTKVCDCVSGSTAAFPMVAFSSLVPFFVRLVLTGIETTQATV